MSPARVAWMACVISNATCTEAPPSSTSPASVAEPPSSKWPSAKFKASQAKRPSSFPVITRALPSPTTKVASTASAPARRRRLGWRPAERGAADGGGGGVDVEGDGEDGPSPRQLSGDVVQQRAQRGSRLTGVTHGGVERQTRLQLTQKGARGGRKRGGGSVRRRGRGRTGAAEDWGRGSSNLELDRCPALHRGRWTRALDLSPSGARTGTRDCRHCPRR